MALTSQVRLIIAFAVKALAQFQLANNDMCFLAKARSTVANDVIYFMGGRYTTRGQGLDNDYANTLFAIPLNVTFPGNAALQANAYRTISAPSSVPTQQGAFFKDASEELLYSFAGFDGNDTSSPSATMSTFNTTSETWSSTDVSGGDFNFGTRWGAATTNTDMTNLGLGFISGGYDPIGGMVTYDSVNNTWTNMTSVAANISDGSIESAMVFTRFGAQGTLILLGGNNKEDGNVTTPTGTAYSERSMSNIGVFNIASQTWSTVQAAGDVPQSRLNPCAAASTAPDNSSVNILVYGGYNDGSQVGWTETYILSLPSFRWINVTSAAAATDVVAGVNGGNPVGVVNHFCHTYQDRQMISIGGGLMFDSNPVNRLHCNDSWPMVRVFDTSLLTWKQQFNPKAQPYFIPQAVVNVIGGNENGSATVTSPSNGFASNLASVFTTMIPLSTSGTTSSASSTATASSSKDHAGAIAGGVVGGVVILALILGIAWFMLRRNRRRRQREGYAAAREQDSPELTDTKEQHPRGGELEGSPGMYWAKQKAAGELDGESQRHELHGQRENIGMRELHGPAEMGRDRANASELPA